MYHYRGMNSRETNVVVGMANSDNSAIMPETYVVDLSVSKTDVSWYRCNNLNFGNVVH